MSSNLNVTVSLDPIWERFDAVDANAAVLTDRIKRLEERARAEDDGNREALALANNRVAELEQQLDAHHHRDIFIEEQLEAIDRAIAGITKETDDPLKPVGQRVRLAIDTLAHRANTLQGELNGMHQRERQVDKVVAAWDNGSLKGYDGTIDPETPAGRVVELLREVCKARSTSVLEPRGAALDAILANLREYGLDLVEDDYPTGLVKAVSVALRDRADALQQLRTIGVALNMHRDGRDPMTLTLKHPADTAARVAEALSLALKSAGGSHLEVAAVMGAWDRGELATLKVREDSLAERVAHTLLDGNGVIADEINKAAANAEQAIAVTESDDEVDAAAADAFVAGLRAAAQIAAGDTPEADPNVAHIDTVNGRGAHVQRPDDRPDASTDPQETE